MLRLPSNKRDRAFFTKLSKPED
ncbi:uncharacterized protein METZ01_LOCUS447391 [marine metagenome]|uniref:Uncharacterized protein n=1 Tax=marine metagenome TaxID=408172 RepID=A0A382ZG73_9ZZZZ